MLNFFCQALRSIFRSSQRSDFPAPSKLDSASWNRSLQRLHNLAADRDKKRLIFLIGPWGSGKSTLISTFIAKSEFKKSLYVNRCSLKSVEDLEDAYIFLINHWLKVAAAAVLAGFTLYSVFRSPNKDGFEFPSSISTILLTALAVLLFRNYQRISFTAYMYASDILSKFSGTPRLLVIEDFDRSCLAQSEILSIISNLPRMNSVYVIPLGYRDELQRLEYVEMAKKLDGELLFLAEDPDILRKIWDDLYPSLQPFQNRDWLKNFTARELLSLLERIRVACIGHDHFDSQVCTIQSFIRHVVIKHKIDRHSLNVRGNREVTDGNMTQVKFLSPMTVDIKPELINIWISKTVPQDQRAHAGDTAISTLFLRINNQPEGIEPAEVG